MLSNVLFTAWALFIPAVPLYGISHYKSKKDNKRMYICIFLFVMQLLISIASITEYLK